VRRGQKLVLELPLSGEPLWLRLSLASDTQAD